MGTVSVLPDRAAKHGCSDCVMICGFKNILLEQGEMFPDSHRGAAGAAPLFWLLCVSHCTGVPKCTNGNDAQAHSIQGSPFSDRGFPPRKGELWRLFRSPGCLS